jgi:hypothetical protein
MLGKWRDERQEAHDRLLALEAMVLVMEAEQRVEAIRAPGDAEQPRRRLLPSFQPPRVKSYGAFYAALAIAHGLPAATMIHHLL